jgi:hypothetical protein
MTGSGRRWWRRGILLLRNELAIASVKPNTHPKPRIVPAVGRKPGQLAVAESVQAKLAKFAAGASAVLVSTFSLNTVERGRAVDQLGQFVVAIVHMRCAEPASMLNSLPGPNSTPSTTRYAIERPRLGRPQRKVPTLDRSLRSCTFAEELPDVGVWVQSAQGRQRSCDCSKSRRWLGPACERLLPKTMVLGNIDATRLQPEFLDR